MNPTSANLLVVDDSEPIRAVIIDLMYELGFRSVDEACDGAAALELFKRKPYDVVITDWEMPQTNGLELLRSIRAGEERNDTPVVVLTGNASSERAVQAIEAGANGFVAKPFVAPALCDKVLRVVASLQPVVHVETPTWSTRAANDPNE